MKTLYLDLGTTVGFLIHDNETGEIKSGSYFSGPIKKEDTNIRFSRFNKWLSSKLTAFDIKQVYYEQVMRHISTASAHVYGGFSSILYMNCIDRGIPYNGVGVMVIKKAVTGNGHAKKDQMLDAIKRLGYKTTDHNEADAIGIYITIKRRIEKPLNRYETDIQRTFSLSVTI